MASLVLSVAGARARRRLFGPVGAIAGAPASARFAGNAIDRALFGGHSDRSVEGPRLADLDVMASTEGAPIPRVYGRARLAGQVIWATHLEEVVSDATPTASGGKGGRRRRQRPRRRPTPTSPISRSACARGRSARCMRVWADGKPLDLTGLTMRVYAGDETQTPDPLIVAKEGAMRRPIAGSPMSCSSGCRWPISATAFRNCRSSWCARSASSNR